MVDEDTIGVVSNKSETFRPDLKTKADDAGVSLSDIEPTGDDQTAFMARDETGGFFDDPIEADPSKRRVAPTDIHREPDGEFTYPQDETRPATGTDARRGPDGRYVSDDLEDANIGREESNGLFDLLR